MKKVLVLILAYNAERHIVGVLDRLPARLWGNADYTTDVVVIDDCSSDATSQVAREAFGSRPFPIRLLRNARNQGYGGNQKVGYAYAIDNGFDAVIMLHGDGQYPPESIPDMVEPLIAGQADAVFGSRMLNKKDALAGGMPYYKFAGNIVLTTVQNWMLGSRLSEFHTGFRAYSVAALKRVPFAYNSNVFHFDTDIIIQFVDRGMHIVEIPIPTRYGDEICHVNGMRYALDVMISTVISRVQKFGIFYAPKFDYGQLAESPDKTRFTSSHRFVLDHIDRGDRVLYLASDKPVLTRYLEDKNCHVTSGGIDYSDFDNGNYNVVILLDVVEHLAAPEAFLQKLYAACTDKPTRILVTTPNIAFIVQRLMLLAGQFNYSKRGVLDRNHTRLFTVASLKRLFEDAGFTIRETRGIPAPYPVAFGDTMLSRALLSINTVLVRLWKSLFSYQIGLIAEPRPTLDALVKQAIAGGEQVK